MIITVLVHFFTVNLITKSKHIECAGIYKKDLLLEFKFISVLMLLVASVIYLAKGFSLLIVSIVAVLVLNFIFRYKVESKVETSDNSIEEGMDFSK